MKRRLLCAWSAALLCLCAAGQAWAQGGAAPAEAAGELRDIAPPVAVPFWTPKTIALAVVSAGVLLGGLLWAYRIWRGREKPAPAPLDPVEVALRGLAALRADAAESLSGRDFAAAAAEVLRAFLEARHGLAAPRQTTEEFLAAVENSEKFGPDGYERLQRFLRQCDLLKFAGEQASYLARGELLEMAESVVKEGAK